MRKMRKFAEGGSDKYKAKYDRKVADIESDFAKAKARKTGRGLEVAEAKYEQRMADAKDDLAKWTGGDRTATRAGEKAAERNLSLTRRYGSAKPKFEDKPLVTPKGPSEAEMAKISTMAPTPKSQSFKEAFAAARKNPEAMKAGKFTWDGKSYSTALAGEKPKATRSTSARAAPAKATPAKATPAKATPAPAAKANPPAKAQTPPAKAPATPAKAPAAKPALTTSQRYNARSAELAREAQREAAAEKAQGSAGARARLKNMFGFGSSGAERASKMYSRLAESTGAQERAMAESKRKEAAANAARDAERAKRRAAIIAKGKEPGASGYARSTAKFYEKYPDAKKKGGLVKKHAKGGKIDGCAVRGKTRAK